MLFALQVALRSAPDGRGLAEALASGLSALPGVRGAAVCLDGEWLAPSSAPPRCARAGTLERCREACTAEAPAGLLQLRLQTARGTLGAVVLEGATPAGLAPSDRALLEHTAHVAALLLDDHGQRAQDHSLLGAERERLAATLRSLADAVVTTDDAGRVTQLNFAAEELTGWRADEALGHAVDEVAVFVDEQTRERVAPIVARALATGEPARFDEGVVLIARDGTERPVADVCAPYHDAAGRTAGAVLVLRDQTVERSMLAQLADSEERFRSYVENARHLLFVVDEGGHFVDFNPAALAFLGYTGEELAETRVQDLTLADDRAQFAADLVAAQREGRHEGEYRVKRRDGAVVYLAVQAVKVQAGRTMAICTDVTERRRVEEQLRQAQKMEAVGRLAGGIAHDFNNLLTVILSCTEVMKEDLATGRAPSAEDIDEVFAAGTRARELTRQLLAFARKQVIAPVALDLNAVVRNSEKMLRRVLGEDVVLQVEAEPALWTALCDPGQVEQVLINLVVNARDAMPEGGTLTIATANVVLPAAAAATTTTTATTATALQGARAAPAASREWVSLRVRDTGAGITPEVQAHLFEPFFTTKAVGKGTGLGLATVHGIVAQSGGEIRVESAPGAGTLFEIRFPRLVAPAVVTRTPTLRPPRRGSETILAVEDDPQVRAVTIRALRGAGYRVLVASEGREALALARAHGAPLDLVVTDVVMPGMSGRDVVEALRREQPGLRVLYVSGYTQDAIAERGVLDSGVEFLPKPFTLASLLARVRAVLDAG